MYRINLTGGGTINLSAGYDEAVITARNYVALKSVPVIIRNDLTGEEILITSSGHIEKLKKSA